jgi:hypothetical protein
MDDEVVVFLLLNDKDNGDDKKGDGNGNIMEPINMTMEDYISLLLSLISTYLSLITMFSHHLKNLIIIQ